MMTRRNISKAYFNSRKVVCVCFASLSLSKTDNVSVDACSEGLTWAGIPEVRRSAVQTEVNNDTDIVNY